MAENQNNLYRDQNLRVLIMPNLINDLKRFSGLTDFKLSPCGTKMQASHRVSSQSSRLLRICLENGIAVHEPLPKGCYDGEKLKVHVRLKRLDRLLGAYGLTPAMSDFSNCPYLDSSAWGNVDEFECV